MKVGKRHKNNVYTFLQLYVHLIIMLIIKRHKLFGRSMALAVSMLAPEP